MKLGRSVIVFFLFLVLVGCGGKPPRSCYEQEGGFSYDPPPGWTVLAFPGLKYRVARGPAESAFASNINVVDESFIGTVSAYADANLKTMENMLQGYALLNRDEFRTADGVTGTRVVVQQMQGGRKLRQTFYFFGVATRKYVVTCTALADGGESLDGVFAESMKTFRLH